MKVASLKERVRLLKDKVLNIRPSLCSERGRIVTESFEKTEGLPQLSRRAAAFKDTLENMSIHIAPGELIVGNQAGKPRAAPLFPEFSISFLEEELEDFPERPFDAFEVDDETRAVVKKISPYWKGKTHEDRVMALTRLVLPHDILVAWDEESFVLDDVVYVGVRKASGDGHIIPDYEKLLAQGFQGVIQEASKVAESLDLATDPDAYRNKLFLEAVKTSYEAAVNFVLRYSRLAKEMSTEATESRDDLRKLADVCQGIADRPPHSFQEALQLVYFIHLLIHIESNGHSVSLGRMDKHLYPYYKSDLDQGRLTRNEAVELVECFYLKLFELSKVRPWSETRYKSGYPLFMTITLGGQTKDGDDATNELTYVFLDALAETRLPQPTVILRVHSKSPHELVAHACEALAKHGGGLPAFFGDEVVVLALTRLGISPDEARDYAIVGCSEAVVPGKSLSIVGGTCYFNLLKMLEITLNGGVNPRTGTCLWRAEQPEGFKDVEHIFEAFCERASHYMRFIVPLTSVTSATDADLNPTPFASALLDWRLHVGRDISEGGGPNARYSHTIIQGHGAANVGNALYAIDRLVFKEKRLSLRELVRILGQNYCGPLGEFAKSEVLKLPKFGNDVDEVDSFVTRVAHVFAEELKKYTPWRGGVFGGSLQGLTANVPEGDVTGATPDGRLAGEPLADNISPSAGTDVNGPTAVLRSVSKIDHSRFVNGNILNLKLHPSMVDSRGNILRLAEMVRTFLVDLKGNQVQFNVVSAEELRKAQQEPHKYSNLVVKVAGYSAYFVTLEEKLQNQVIARTEHRAF